MTEKLPIQSDVDRIEKFRKDLESQETRFQRHITKKHNGYPVENCHDCGYYIQAILNDQVIIKDLEGNA